MSWTQSLIRVREFEIETLRKRLGGVVENRARVETMVAALDLEAELESRHVQQNAEAGWSLAAFRAGWKLRKAKALADLKTLGMEEQGCRDALSEAFLELKKVEKVAANQAAAAARSSRSPL
jgi:flagellar FliJ protein